MFKYKSLTNKAKSKEIGTEEWVTHNQKNIDLYILIYAIATTFLLLFQEINFMPIINAVFIYPWLMSCIFTVFKLTDQDKSPSDFWRESFTTLSLSFYKYYLKNKPEKLNEYVLLS
jgi:hypothetical protein